jgi:hypothetical protein
MEKNTTFYKDQKIAIAIGVIIFICVGSIWMINSKWVKQEKSKPQISQLEANQKAAEIKKFVDDYTAKNGAFDKFAQGIFDNMTSQLWKFGYQYKNGIASVRTDI